MENLIKKTRIALFCGCGLALLVGIVYGEVLAHFYRPESDHLYRLQTIFKVIYISKIQSNILSDIFIFAIVLSLIALSVAFMEAQVKRPKADVRDK